MRDAQKTKVELRRELVALRQRVAELEAAESDRQRAEQREHEARLYAESILDTVREPLLVLNSDLYILSTNQAFYQTFQVSPEQTENQYLYTLGNGQWNIPALRQLLEDILPQNTQFKDFEMSHDFPTIGQRVMVLNARRIEQGHDDSQIILLAIEDITARKQAEALLQERTDLLEVTLTSIGDAVVVTDRTGGTILLNAEATRLTGWMPQEAVGRQISEVLPLLNEQTRQRAESPVSRVLRKGGVVGLANDTIVVTRDGREIPIADSMAPIYSPDGTFHGVVMVFRDITAQRHAEQELLSARETAEAANRMKDEFLATMSHELRTPLSIIIGYTNLLLEDTFGSLPDAATDILRRVGRNADELFALITALLDLSRLEAGQGSATVETVQLPAFLETIQTDMQGLWELAHLEFVWRVEPQLPALVTDLEKLKTVVKNLVSNAVKFTAQGRITVEARAHEGGVEIRVTDTGIGIPEEAQAAIFESFYQVDRVSTRRYGGVGLGLHIVKRLLEVLGGSIAVESAVGRGSTFRVWLPTRQRPAQSAS